MFKTLPFADNAYCDASPTDTNCTDTNLGTNDIIYELPWSYDEKQCADLWYIKNICRICSVLI